MEYKIKSIKHSGRKELRGTDRTDGRYQERVGRTVNLDNISDYKIGNTFWINYLRLADGSDYSNMCLRCSRLVKITDTGDTVMVETNNTIYEFEKCK